MAVGFFTKPSKVKSADYGIFLITRKVLDARRRGATTEAYGAIRRKPVESLKVEREERSKATPPFGFAQGHESFDLAQDRESFDFAQDRELVERLVERPVERKLDFLRSHQGVNEMESDLRERIADLNRTADEIRGRL